MGTILTKRDISFASFSWREPSADSGGFAWVMVDVVPIKDDIARRSVCPLPIRRRSRDGVPRGDAMCTYDAFVAAWEMRMASCGVAG